MLWYRRIDGGATRPSLQGGGAGKAGIIANPSYGARSQPVSPCTNMRYDQTTKDQVVGFVQQHNQENNGRGGVAEAVRQFGISALTINSWLKKANGGNAASSKKKAKAKRPTRKTSAPSGGTVGVLNRMAAIQDEIDLLRQEFDSLKAQL